MRYFCTNRENGEELEFQTVRAVERCLERWISLGTEIENISIIQGVEVKLKADEIISYKYRVVKDEL